MPQRKISTGMWSFLREAVGSVSPHLSAFPKSDFFAEPESVSGAPSTTVAGNSTPDLSISQSKSVSLEGDLRTDGESASKRVRSDLGGDGVFFLGCGSSAGMPMLNHLLPFYEASHPFNKYATGQQPLIDTASLRADGEVYRRRLAAEMIAQGKPVESTSGPDIASSTFACVPCLEALMGPPEKRRRNISLLLTCQGRRILFDCGKTFRDSVVSFGSAAQVLFQMSGIDALALSHDHADAMGGLDDLRDLQEFIRPPVDLSQLSGQTPDPSKRLPRWYSPVNWMPCFLGERTLLSLCRVFSYLAAPYIHYKNALRAAGAAETLRQVDSAVLPGSSEDPLIGASEDDEFVWSASGRLVMQRKVACLDFRLLNDKVPVLKAEGETRRDELPLLKRLSSELQQLARGVEPTLTDQEVKDFFEFCPTKENGFSKIELPGMETAIYSFPVFHGGSYVCLGFCVLGKENLLIITDCTDVPQVVREELRKIQWEVLIVDCLGERPHTSHFHLQASLDFAVYMQPKRVFLVGMECQLWGPATLHRLNKWLSVHREMYKEQEGRDSRLESVEMASDGRKINMNF